MKTEIGQLHLQLPAGFEGRAQRIGRLVAEALARRENLPAGRFDRVGIGPVQIDGRLADRTVAESIATSICAALSRHRDS